MKANTRLLLLIRENDLMQPNGCDFMQLYRVKKPYEIIERILINVAAKNGMTWKQLLETKYSQTELFAELCTAVILIDKYLYDVFSMDEKDRYSLVGYEYAQIIDEYKKFVNEN